MKRGSQRGATILPIMLAGAMASSACTMPTFTYVLHGHIAQAKMTSERPVEGGARLHPRIVISIVEVVRIARHAADEVGVNPALVRAVILNESDYDPNAISKTGAKGLMQLSTDASGDCGLFGDKAFQPADNVACGTRLLGSLLRRFPGHLGFAIAAYNAGPVTVERYGGIPPYHETQRYVSDVLATYRRYLAER